MKKIKFIGRYRGFLNDLFNFKSSKITIEYNKASEFEVIKKNRQFLLRLFNNRIFDVLGLFTKLSDDSDVQYLLSYNRFISCNEGKKYAIILENPTALVNYSNTKMFSKIAKGKLERLFNDPNLASIVCISKACEEGFDKYYPNHNLGDRLTQIYPLINVNKSISEEYLSKQSQEEVLNVLYVSANFTLKGGEDILKTFTKLSKNQITINLTIITKINNLSEKQLEQINKFSNINLLDFTLSRDELSEYYSRAQILLNPTRMDSFSLVTLEAIKHGCAVVGSDIYAIKEMVHENKNGFLIKPKYQYWNDDNTINHYVMKHPKKTYEANYLDEKMVSFIYDKLVYLNEKRQILSEFQRYSFNLSKNDDFNENYIMKKWESIYS